MLRLMLALALGGASSACALAAVAWVVYGQSPAVVSAVQIFAAYGLLAGLACGALHLHFQGRPAAAPAALSSAALASLVRATLASAAAQRAPLPGSAADQHPDAAPVLATGSTTAAAPLPPVAAPAPAPAHPLAAETANAGARAEAAAT